MIPQSAPSSPQARRRGARRDAGGPAGVFGRGAFRNLRRRHVRQRACDAGDLDWGDLDVSGNRNVSTPSIDSPRQTPDTKRSVMTACYCTFPSIVGVRLRFERVVPTEMAGCADAPAGGA